MSTGQRIIKNSFFLTTGQVLSKIVNLGLILVFTRYLGKEGFGLYSFSFAYVGLFLFISYMGMVREIAKNKDKAQDILSKTLPLVVIWCLGFLLLVNIIPFILEWNKTERLIILAFSFYFIFDTLGNYFFGVLRAFERMEFQAILNVIERILFMTTALLFWHFDLSLNTLVFSLASVMGLKAFVAFSIVKKKFVRFSLCWSFHKVSPFLKDAFPFALMTLFMTITARIDIVMLKEIHSIETVAIYSTARKIIESFSFIPESIYIAVFPALSILYMEQKEKFNYTFKQTLIVITVISIPVTAGLFILAPRIINLLFEPEFYPAYIPLQWLSLALLLIFVRQALSAALNTTGKQHIFSIIFGIAMGINILMNFLLIPKYEVVGASIALIASETFLILGSIPFISKQVDLSWSKIFIPKILIATIVISLVIYLIRDWHFLSIIFIVIIAYSTMLILLRIFSISEIKQYAQIFVKKNRNES